jgi:hypothetical protein
VTKRTIIAVSLMISLLSAGSVSAADQTYLAVRGGVFLPNAEDGDNYQGLNYFDTGYNIEIAVGYRPVSYAELELGTGFYSCSGEISKPDFTIDRTLYGVPITLNVKGILEFDKLTLSAGGGLGLYQGFMDNKIDFVNQPSVDESNHGTAVGYQAVFDADLKLNDRWSVGANFKWFSARPKIELQTVNSTQTQIITTKDEWEIGGTTLNIGVKYLF